jgi:hypothetical protein
VELETERLAWEQVRSEHSSQRPSMYHGRETGNADNSS